MTEEYLATAKVYPTENLGKYSILDMLNYFAEQGAMRVSDLHIKVVLCRATGSTATSSGSKARM